METAVGKAQSRLVRSDQGPTAKDPRPAQSSTLRDFSMAQGGTWGLDLRDLIYMIDRACKAGTKIGRWDMAVLLLSSRFFSRGRLIQGKLAED